VLARGSTGAIVHRVLVAEAGSPGRPIIGTAPRFDAVVPIESIDDA
jgi:hypothetical protein